jgi:hypothetical protein
LKLVFQVQITIHTRRNQKSYDTFLFYPSGRGLAVLQVAEISWQRMGWIQKVTSKWKVELSMMGLQVKAIINTIDSRGNL